MNKQLIKGLYIQYFKYNKKIDDIFCIVNGYYRLNFKKWFKEFYKI